MYHVLYTCLQKIAVLMKVFTEFHINTMVAMHLAWPDVGEWNAKMKAAGFLPIKSPLIIGSSKPVGYSPSWTHKPLSACQPFFLYRTPVATFPTHNAWRVYEANKHAPFRQYWADLCTLKPAQYKKHKDEILKLVSHFRFIFDIHTYI